jgi:hypothetical protein
MVRWFVCSVLVATLLGAIGCSSTASPSEGAKIEGNRIPTATKGRGGPARPAPEQKNPDSN